MSRSSEQQTHFGFKQVPESEKAGKVAFIVYGNILHVPRVGFVKVAARLMLPQAVEIFQEYFDNRWEIRVQS